MSVKVVILVEEETSELSIEDYEHSSFEELATASGLFVMISKLIQADPLKVPPVPMSAADLLLDREQYNETVQDLVAKQALMSVIKHIQEFQDVRKN